MERDSSLRPGHSARRRHRCSRSSGHRGCAPELNVGGRACSLSSRRRRSPRASSPTGRCSLWNEQFFVDSFNVFLVALTAFVGIHHLAVQPPLHAHRAGARHGSPPARLRLYHSMYQMFNFTMLLALLTNNVGILWVAMEAATLTTVLLVSLYRTPASLEAAWKYFILCGVGHRAGAVRHDPALLRRRERCWAPAAPRCCGRIWTRSRASSSRRCCRSRSCSCWSATAPRSGSCRCTTGCPTRTPKARRRSRRCCPGCCSTSRCMRSCAARCWSKARSAPTFAGNLMMGFGLLSVVVAAFLLSRQKDVKRLFAYSSIEHMGLMTFAFGMGGPVATFAGLLHMTVHSLTKSAIFFAVGHAAQKTGTQVMDDIRGLIDASPTIGWGLMLGHPRDPRHAAVRRVRERVPDPHDGDARAAVGDAVPAARARAWRSPRSSARCSRWCSARRRAKRLPHRPALIPVFVHLALVLLLGLVHSAVPRRVVPAGGAADRLR